MKPQEAAEELKSEAKHKLCRMFDIPEGYSSGVVERIVDCIVGAAILETADLMSKAQPPAPEQEGD